MNDHDRLGQLYHAVVGNGMEGLVARQKRLEDKMDDHTKWHLAQRMAILLAVGGWTVAVVLGVVAFIV